MGTPIELRPVNGREEAPLLPIAKTAWDLSPLFSGDDDPRIVTDQTNTKNMTDAFNLRWAGTPQEPRTDYLEDPLILKAALDDYEKISRMGAAEYYFTLRTSLDNDAELEGQRKKAEEFRKKLANNTRFFRLQVAKIPPDRQEAFVEHPELAEYKHFLERLWTKAPHMLSEAEERILTTKSGTSRDNWIRMTSSLLAKAEREVALEDGSRMAQTLPQLLGLLQSKDKSVRDTAAGAINEILAEYGDIAEFELNSVLEDKKDNDNLRSYDRPDAARHLNDDIDTKVVDAMIQTVASRFDLPQRIYRLKAQLLGLPILQYHERTVPYGDTTTAYSYQEAVDLVYKVLSGLDPEFGKIFAGFVVNGQIDAFPKKGKEGGAFCIGDEGISYLTYILLNFTGKLGSVRTIAHEAGHGIHNEIMRPRQNALTYGASTATSEVASTFMEDFVTQELLRGANDEERLALMIRKLDADTSVVFRQIALYAFEKELHATFREKNYLSQEEIGIMFQKHMAAYMGDAVEQSPGSENWWVYWTHIRNPFYVYSYAMGQLISKSLQRMVKNDPVNIEKVKEFLAAGISDSPQNIFLKAGIDITDPSFWERGLGEVEQLLNETEELAMQLGKIPSKVA